MQRFSGERYARSLVRVSRSRVLQAAIPVAAVILHGSISRADLLNPGSRSGTVGVYAGAYNTGPGPLPSLNQSSSIPTTGAGNVSITNWANTFNVGSGVPAAQPNQVGTNSGVINLGTVSGSSYSLNASANFNYSHGGSSDALVLGPSYTFDQQIVITQPVLYTLQLTVTRPTYAYAQTVVGPESDALLPLTSESFTGPGVSLSLNAPYYPPYDPSNPLATSPLTVTQTFTGKLDPGTYAFDSSWIPPEMWYWNSDQNDTESASVSAALSVSAAVPEPASAMMLMTAGGFLALRRKAKR